MELGFEQQDPATGSTVPSLNGGPSRQTNAERIKIKNGDESTFIAERAELPGQVAAMVARLPRPRFR